MAQRRPNHNNNLLKKLKDNLEIDAERDNSKKSKLYGKLTEKYNEMMEVKGTEFEFEQKAIRQHLHYIKDKDSGKR